jgi:thiamine pyrophosphate-dependent acetolactate synthase large subunit-like protein
MHGMEDCTIHLLTFCVAALNLPGLNAVAVAEAYGCTAFRADTPADLYEAFQQARRINGPVLIEFQIDPKIGNLPI